MFFTRHTRETGGRLSFREGFESSLKDTNRSLRGRVRVWGRRLLYQGMREGKAENRKGKA